MYDTTIKS